MQADIFFLIETHLIAEKTEKIRKYFRGFTLYSVPAVKVSRFGRAVGGFLYGFKNSLRNAGIKIEIIENDVIKLAKVCTQNINITLIPLYLRGCDWSNDFNKVKNLFQEHAITNPITIGDLNVRIGNTQQDIDDLYMEGFKAGKDVRRSKDVTVNAKGNQFMQFCLDENLFVLNGQTEGDDEGSLTYISQQGESVNDICAVHLEILQYVSQFYVDDKIWSDHLPIILTLNLNNYSSSAKIMNTLPKIRWYEKEKLRYQRNLNEKLQSQDNVSNILNIKALSNIIKSSAITPKFRVFEPKNKWYNYKCNNARISVMESLNKYRSTKSSIDKKIYLNKQIKYKTICTQSKELYYQQLASKLNFINDSKQWWKFAREVRGQNYQVGTNISATEFKEYFTILLNPPQTSQEFHYAPMLVKDDTLDRPITLCEL